jgi:glutamate-5-semialdehyde dehydrogenase
MENIEEILIGAKKASKKIAGLTNGQRNEVLASMAEALLNNIPKIIAANQLDLDLKEDTDPMKDRLMLNPSRIEALATGLNQLIELPQPDRKIVSSFTKDNGLKISKVLVPLGVVATIYESRPNVTIDIAAISLKSGNASILRGGSDAWNTNQCFKELLHGVLAQHSLPLEAIVFYPIEREHVLTLLHAEKYVDMIIPRGSASLIDFVKKNSLVPSIETGAGVCHTYVSKHADLEVASRIVINAKTTRPSVCNSLDTILVDKNVAIDFLDKVLPGIEKFKVEIFADEYTLPILEKKGYPYISKASEATFETEFLDFKCNLKVVENINEAIAHIEKYSTRHSEAIVSADTEEIDQFIREVDTASVYANASTRFTDGFEFNLGAEIGISTQKLHARGPFALEKLVCEKWIGIGNGQIRG